MSHARRPSIRIVALVLLGVMTGACGDATGTTTTGAQPPSTTSAPTTTTPPSTTSTEPAIADVQSGIDWFVAVLNGEQLSEDDYVSRFADEFREQVPFEEGFQPVLDQFRPAGPYTVVERTGEGAQGEAVVESADGTRARLLAEIDQDGRFSGLLIQPAEGPSLEEPPDSIGDAVQRLAGIGSPGALAAEIVEGECLAIEGAAANEPVPLGSVFKLYVLAALGDAIDEGRVSWDDEIVIRDELKSIPSGTLQDRDDGETVSVHEAAELMISISDNTATDHLMDMLGREAVEAAMVDYGNTTPELNTPFLNTREFTALKVGPASGLRIQWVEGDEATRRSLLAQISDITPADLPIQEWTTPVDPDLVEWFATPSDLCNLAVGLLSLDERVPEIGSILGLNPGIPAAQGTWDRLWFKGGSEPGLLAAWFVTEAEGRVFFSAGSVVDSGAAIDGEEAILLFAAIRDLLAP